MTSLDQLEQVMNLEADRLRASVPPDRAAAILALLHLIDHQAYCPDITPQPDLLTGQQITNAGGNLALHLCLDAPKPDGSRPVPAPWAGPFLASCHRLACAGIVHGHCESGFMRMVTNPDGSFDAWVASRRPPPRWQEHADIAWWSASLTRAVMPELARLATLVSDPARPLPRRAEARRRLVDAHLKRMAWQLTYPPDATIGDVHIQTCLEILAALIGYVIPVNKGRVYPQSQTLDQLVIRLATDLDLPGDNVETSLSLLTLDRDNATWHAAVPGIAAAPLVRTAPDRIALSTYGLLSQPILFLTRELKRQNQEAYHNAAFHREDIFRQDLASVFSDKRFTTSTGRIALRRERGDLRTDIDAVVFDRKTGTMGVFELKSQDPFARSIAEQARQRDNILYANRQVSGVLAFVQKHGGDEILSRVDRAASKKFRVHKVYPFVLGRYLVHFDDGPAPDHRAAWATWPQFLRQLDGTTLRSIGTNPIATLFTRLSGEAPTVRPAGDLPKREIDLPGARLTIWPTYNDVHAGDGH